MMDDGADYRQQQELEEEEMSTQKLFPALVKAQAMMRGAVKDSDNPFFKSKYADLSSVISAIRPALESNGLGFIQRSHDSDKSVKIETVIIHESGETYSCGIVSVPVAKNDAQAYGSAITYAKRFGLQAGFGVPSVDDDGNAAAQNPEIKKDFSIVVKNIEQYTRDGLYIESSNEWDKLTDDDKKIVWRKLSKEAKDSIKAGKELIENEGKENVVSQ